MTTTNRLFYTVSKRYIQARTTFKINISRFPNFHKSGSIRGMKSVAALLVRCGSYIYNNVISEPNIYNNANMFCLMLLLFGAVVFISGIDPKKLKDFINKNDQSDKF